jgi:hypothetical protein
MADGLIRSDSLEEIVRLKSSKDKEQEEDGVHSKQNELADVIVTDHQAGHSLRGILFMLLGKHDDVICNGNFLELPVL